MVKYFIIMKLVISIDVEEEGLFSGAYARTPTGVSNVAELRRLEFIPREFGFPLTLLATYHVARDPEDFIINSVDKIIQTSSWHNS